MALQDLAPFDPSTLIDPDTGKPYAYGSPEYNRAMAPYLLGELNKNGQRSSNARGAFYSGGAIADESQAASSMLAQLTQSGAAQAAQEKMQLEAERFQAQQQAAQAQAAMDSARVQGKEGAKAAAIGGATGAVGQLGGMYLLNKMLHTKDAPIPTTAAPGAVAGTPMSVATPMPGYSDMGGGGVEAPFTSTIGKPGDFSELSSVGQGAPGGGGDLFPGGFESDFGPMGSPTATPTPGFMPGSGTMAMPGLGTMAASAPAAMLGAEAGLRTFGNSDRNKVGAGIGGGLGMIAGNAVLPGVGGPVGAAAGSFLGPEYAKHPGLAMLGPAGLPLMIPGVSHTLQPIGNAINKGGQDVADFIRHLF